MNDRPNNQAGLDQAMVQATMDIAAAGDWASCRLVDIAAVVGLNPSALPARYRDKTDVLRVLADKLDAEVLAAVDVSADDPDIPVRERLLEVLMQRFDTMAPCKAGITGVLRAIPLSPSTIRYGVPALVRSMRLRWIWSIFPAKASAEHSGPRDWPSFSSTGSEFGLVTTVPTFR